MEQQQKKKGEKKRRRAHHFAPPRTRKPPLIKRTHRCVVCGKLVRVNVDGPRVIAWHRSSKFQSPKAGKWCKASRKNALPK